MTIASAFNDIAVAQGGTASTSGAIDDAARAMAAALGETIVVEEATVETIDSLTDKTIEDAVTLLGKHIGGGGGEEAHLYELFTDPESYAARDWHWVQNGQALAEGELFEVAGMGYALPIIGAVAGNIVLTPDEGASIDVEDYTVWESFWAEYPFKDDHDDMPDPLLDFNFYGSDLLYALAYKYTGVMFVPIGG